jgi:hypothetical protein
VNPADRIALRDRLAIGLAWTELEEHERARHRRRADALIAEVEVAGEQTDRIGWMLVEADSSDSGIES